MVLLLRFLLLLPVAALLLFITVSNTATVDFVWSPLHDPLAVNIAAIILSAVGVGFLWGGLTVWLNSLQLYGERSRQRKIIRRLEKDLEAANQNAIGSVKHMFTTPKAQALLKSDVRR